MIYDYIKKSVPLNLGKLEIARYLYIKLGSLVSFSTVINNTDAQNFYRLINLRIDPNSFDSNQVNCFTWAQLYSALLSDFGIRNTIVKYWHAYVNFYIDDVVWVADATFGKYTDLSRIHYGDETFLFGPCIYQKSNINSNIVDFNDYYLNLIKNIDDKIDYSSKIGDLKIFKRLLSNIKDSSDDFFYKLDFLFDSIGCLSFGYYEAKDFIFDLEKILFNYSDIKRIGSVELKRFNSPDSIDIIQCLYVKCDNGYRYYLICPNLPIRCVSVEDVRCLSYYGFFSGKKQIPGVCFDYLDAYGRINKMSEYDFVQSKVKKKN